MVNQMQHVLCSPHGNIYLHNCICTTWARARLSHAASLFSVSRHDCRVTVNCTIMICDAGARRWGNSGWRDAAMTSRSHEFRQLITDLAQRWRHKLQEIQLSLATRMFRTAPAWRCYPLQHCRWENACQVFEFTQLYYAMLMEILLTVMAVTEGDCVHFFSWTPIQEYVGYWSGRVIRTCGAVVDSEYAASRQSENGTDLDN